MQCYFIFHPVKFVRKSNSHTVEQCTNVTGNLPPHKICYEWTLKYFGEVQIGPKGNQYCVNYNNFPCVLSMPSVSPANELNCRSPHFSEYIVEKLWNENKTMKWKQKKIPPKTTVNKSHSKTKQLCGITRAVKAKGCGQLPLCCVLFELHQ